MGLELLVAILEMNRMIVKIILASIIPLLPLLPLTIFMVKDSGKMKTVGLFSLIFFSYQMILKLPTEMNELQIIQGKWNWTGKVFGVLFGILSYLLLRHKLSPFTFLQFRQKAKSLKTTWLLTIMITCTSFLAYFDTSKPFDIETLLYQLTMPGFDEEIMFRGVLLGLLLTCFKDKIVIGGKEFRNPSVLFVGLLFGLTHAFMITDNLGIKFEPYSFIWTSILGYAWGWITVESKSILQSVLSHNMLNFTTNIIRMSN